MKGDPRDHPALLIIYLIDTPSTFALLVEAVQQLCGAKTIVSIPASEKTSLIHLVRVSLEANLCGLLQVLKSCETLKTILLCSSVHFLQYEVFCHVESRAILLAQ